MNLEESKNLEEISISYEKIKAEFGVLAHIKDTSNNTITTEDYKFELKSTYEIDNVLAKLNDEEESKSIKSEEQSTCEETMRKPIDVFSNFNKPTFNIDPLKNFFFLVYYIYY